MLQKDFENILDVLKLMKELELIVAELYRTCGQCWIDEKEFWMKMEQSEMKHAQHIDRLIQIMLERPQAFELGHSFRRPAVQVFISGLKAYIPRLKKNEIPKEKMLFIARDIEQSILESKYGEIIRTNDIEFQDLIRQIVLDTTTHKDSLNKKLGEKKGEK